MKKPDKRDFKVALLWESLGCAVFFALWQALSLYFKSEIILPSPLLTLKKFFLIALTQNFLMSLLMSFLRVMGALIFSVPLGLVLGLICALNIKINYFFRPLFNLIASTPVMAVILILFLWLGAELTPAFSAFLIIFPVISANTIEAVRNVEPNLLELFKSFEISRKEKIKYLFIPEILPYLSAALNSSLALSWKVVVAAEVLVQPVLALGTGMQIAKANLETSELFAWTFASVIAASLCTATLRFIQKQFQNRD